MLNAQCHKILYYAIIYPNIIFCTSVWVGTYRSTMNLVITFLGVRQITSSAGLFQELGILEPKDVLKYETATYVYRSLNNPNLDEFSLQRYNQTNV